MDQQVERALARLDETTIFLVQAVEAGVLSREEVEPLIEENREALNAVRRAA
jgi:hypothetical protein